MPEPIEQLFQRYLDNRCSPEEIRQLWEFLEKEDNSAIRQLLIKRYVHQLPVLPDHSDPLLTDKLRSRFDLIRDAIGHMRPDGDRQDAPANRVMVMADKIRRRSWRWLAAACVMVSLTGAYIFLSPRKKSTLPSGSLAGKHPADILPGTNRAILTLSNGATINLDEAKDGILARQGNAKVTKIGNGQLVYDRPARDGIGKEQAAIDYNTLSTPKGGQYRLKLPDGSQVWLNAASSIRYPTVFAGGERIVEISGEAYFEIQKDPSRPFRVKVAPIHKAGTGERPSDPGGMSIQVLGTDFNVNAYDDEAIIKTTLLEGAVNVVSGPVATLLKPGDQAQVNKQGKLKLVQDIDPEEVVAWKNGHFVFNNVDLQVVMRQLARWYDVEIVYAHTPPPMEFEGEIQMNLSLQQVMRILEKYKVHCTLENKKLMVMPNT